MRRKRMSKLIEVDDVFELVYDEAEKKVIPEKMTCKCGSERIVNICGHSVDENVIKVGNFEIMDYLPGDMGIGDAGDIEFSYCLQCGQIQGEFPVKKTKLEKHREKKEKKQNGKQK
jgi:hypothetical protein